jgi:PAS domain S-box-containing protein
MEHLGEEIPIPGGKEVCELTLAFNTMSKSLLRHREQLEGLVRERTEQLSSANEVLGREIEERTRIARSLELERNKLKLILDSMKDGVFITNPEHDIEYANPVVEAEFGPPGGRKCYEYFHGLTETCPQCRNEDVFAGELVSWELFVPKLDKVFENLATQLENCDGTWSKLTIYRDITARKQTEEALRESEEKYREFFEHAPLGIFRTTMEGRFVEANPALAAMLGYRSPSELVASISNIAEQLYVYPEMRGEFVDSVLSGNSPQKKDVPLRCKDGRIRMTRITVRPVRKGEKEWKYLEGIVEDITESKLAEEALHRQNEYLSALHETSLTLINRRDVEVLIKSILNRAAILVKAFEGFVYLYQPSGDVLEMQYATGAFEKRVGFRVKPGEGLVGITYLTGEPHIVENYKDWDLHLAASHLSNQACSIMAVPLRYEEKVKGVLGLARTEEQKKFSEEDTAMLSRFASLASVALDNAQLCSDFRRELTERSLLQDELIRSREAANTANRAKSAFLASMSHELRTPLNAILGFSELILDGRLGEISDVQHENLQYVHQAGKHLLTLINDILDLSKVEAGKMVLTLDEVNLCHLIENIAGMFMGQARKQDIAVQIELGDVPDFIPADEVKVKQIFYNLLSNALKFTPEGGVVTIAAHKRDCLLRGSLRRGDQANLRFVVPSEHDPSCPAAVRGQCIEITVADTGIGIPPQWLERIFEPFEQIEKVTHKKHKGTGLGLPITRKLVEMHGGRIWAESDGEDGSTFRFILPIHQDKGLHELARCG